MPIITIGITKVSCYQKLKEGYIKKYVTFAKYPVLVFLFRLKCAKQSFLFIY